MVAERELSRVRKTAVALPGVSEVRLDAVLHER